MEKERIKKLLKKIEFVEHDYKNGLYISIEKMYNYPTIICFDFFQNNVLYNIKFDMDSNIIYDLIKNLKLKELINIDKLIEIKNKYEEKLKELLYNEEKNKDCYFYLLMLNKNVEIEIERLTEENTNNYLNIYCEHKYITDIIDNTSECRSEFYKILNQINIKENSELDNSVFLLNNLNFAKEIIEKNLNIKETINYLEESNYKKLSIIIEHFPRYYIYIQKKYNKDYFFNNIIIKYFSEKYISSVKKDIVIKIIEDQIKDNKFDYIEKFNKKYKKFVLSEIFNKQENSKYREYLIFLYNSIDFSNIEGIETIKEYIDLQKEINDF